MQESLFSASCIPSHELDLHVRTRGRLQCPTQPRVRAHVHVLVRTLRKLDLASVCVYLPEVICKKKNYIWSCSDRRSSACLCCLWIYFSKVLFSDPCAQALIQQIICNFGERPTVLGWKQILEDDFVCLHTCLIGLPLFLAHGAWLVREVKVTFVQVEVE